MLLGLMKSLDVSELRIKGQHLIAADNKDRVEIFQDFNDEMVIRAVIAASAGKEPT